MSTYANMSTDGLQTAAELADLKELVRQYLKLGSCDGRIERRQLRKELADAIGQEYDESEHKVP